MKWLTSEQMRSLTTERLLAYKKKLMPNAPYDEDGEHEDCPTDPKNEDYCPDAAYIEEWNKHYTELKAILKSRPHVPR